MIVLSLPNDGLVLTLITTNLENMCQYYDYKLSLHNEVVLEGYNFIALGTDEIANMGDIVKFIVWKHSGEPLNRANGANIGAFDLIKVAQECKAAMGEDPSGPLMP